MFSSVNLVNRLKKRLNQGGEYFGMIRAPHGLSAGGCSFALRFEESKIMQVKQAAGELGINIIGFFREVYRNDGSKVYEPIG